MQSICEPYFFKRKYLQINRTLEIPIVKVETQSTLDTFLKKFTDIKDRWTVTHLDLTGSAQIGNGAVGAEANKSFGFAWDTENIALYGNCKIMLSWLNKSLDIDGLIAEFKNYLWEQISNKKIKFDNDEKAKISRIFGTNASICLSQSYDWGYNGLPDLFGNSWNFNFNIEVIAGLGIALEFNDKNKWVGISLGACLGVGSSLSMDENYAKGIIFNKTEIVDILLSLLKIKDVKIADKYYVGFGVENGKVVFYYGALKFETDIEAEIIKSKDYVITKKAYYAKLDYKLK